MGWPGYAMENIFRDLVDGLVMLARKQSREDRRFERNAARRRRRRICRNGR